MFTISELAEGFGLPLSTLRYYDELGLLPASGRRGRVRLYSFDDARLLAYIQLLHGEGQLTLEETRAVIDADGPRERNLVTTKRAEEIEVRISHLRAALAVLEHEESCPSPSPLTCPVTGELLRRRAAAALGVDGSKGNPLGG